VPENDVSVSDSSIVHRLAAGFCLSRWSMNRGEIHSFEACSLPTATGKRIAP